jgi:hypothetical protein
MRTTVETSKEDVFRVNDGVVGKTPKTLLNLYQRKGFEVARAGAPSPLSTMGGRQASA